MDVRRRRVALADGHASDSRAVRRRRRPAARARGGDGRHSREERAADVAADRARRRARLHGHRATRSQIAAAARWRSTCRMRARSRRRLLARDVIVDYRPGAGIRVAPHFYTSDDEVERVVEIIDDILAKDEWKKYTQAKTRTSGDRNHDSRHTHSHTDINASRSRQAPQSVRQHRSPRRHPALRGRTRDSRLAGQGEDLRRLHRRSDQGRRRVRSDVASERDLLESVRAEDLPDAEPHESR